MAELTDLTTLTLRDAYFVGLITGCFFMCLWSVFISLANWLTELAYQLWRKRKGTKVNK